MPLLMDAMLLPVEKRLDLTKFNVLIVDDTPVNLGVIVAFLESYGLGIRIARSGKSALQRVEYDSPDIILLDVVMPDVNGFELAMRFKANPKTAEIPIIFVTSLTSVEDKVKAFAVGAVDYVTKPLRQEEVLARITTHLQLRELTKTLQNENHLLQMTAAREKARHLEAVEQQQAQLRALNSRINAVKEEEHKQLARELHDELGQTLTAIQINLAALKRETTGVLSANTRERLDETTTLANQTLDWVREMSLTLRPPMLDDLGLIPTVRWYVRQWAKRTGISAEFQVIGMVPRLHSDSETNLYRIVQESLTNITKHAAATNVCVHLKRKKDCLKLSIEDNGCGFDMTELTARAVDDMGAGLFGIRERTLLMDGRVDIKTELKTGTCITVTLPLSTE
jgi:signal transduction histidine kinase